jgi:GntR family transcriptional regulator
MTEQRAKIDLAYSLASARWLRDGAGPRYLQFRTHLERLIETDQLHQGDSLPPERDLAEMADVSRVTIRKAMSGLAAAGLIAQRRGSGTIVTRPVPRMEHSLSRFTSFTEDMQRRGHVASSRLLFQGVVPPSPAEIFALGLSINDQVTRIERLRMADGVAIALEVSSIAAEFLPDPQAVTTSLYALLSERGHAPARAVQRISAAKLTADQARLLDADVDAAALKIDRTAYLSSGRAIEFTCGYYRGDAYDFVAELRNPS